MVLAVAMVMLKAMTVALAMGVVVPVAEALKVPVDIPRVAGRSGDGRGPGNS